MKYVISYIFLICIIITSSIFNMGWIHFLFSPFILVHAVLMGIVLFSKYGREANEKYKFPFLISAAITYLFLMDGADNGGMYCFYGLIRFKDTSDFVHYDIGEILIGLIWYAVFIYHIYLLVRIIIGISNDKRMKKNCNEV